MLKLDAYIAGKFIKPSEKQLEVLNPLTNEVAGVVPSLSKEQVDLAFKVAKDSFNDWSTTDVEKRIKLAIKFRDIMLTSKDEWAKVMSLEIAKTIKDATVEIERTAEIIDLTIKHYREIHANPVTYTEKEHGAKNKVGKYYQLPLGVVLAISPFNYPVNLLIAKIIPALISGNTVVYKSATQGSLVGGLVASALDKAGYPAGVVNYVTGRGNEIGDYLVAHKLIDMVSFTGSTKIGRQIATANILKPLVLELGGNDPALVCKDANLELVAKEIISGSFSYNGQRCTAIKRVYAESEVYDELVKLLKYKLDKLTCGSPDQNTNITPLINTSSYKFVNSLLEDARNKGATIYQNNFDKKINNLLPPTLVINATSEMDVVNQEQFGPVLPLIKVKDIEAELSVINDNPYGLQASVFSSNVEKANKIALQVEAGTININKAPSRGPDILPFFGIKDSGFGTQGIVDTIYSMTKKKGIVTNN